MPRKKQFKAESKRLLDLMIHSIYTHKEIFLRELVSNASDAIDKYYFENAGHVDANSFEIRIMPDAEARTITISDTGIGISDEGLKRVFERFYREDKARNRSTGGSGLGLSIVKSIMKNYKNDYGFNNTEIGVEFYFDLNLSNTHFYY